MSVGAIEPVGMTKASTTNARKMNANTKAMRIDSIVSFTPPPLWWWGWGGAGAGGAAVAAGVELVCWASSMAAEWYAKRFGIATQSAFRNEHLPLGKNFLIFAE